MDEEKVVAEEETEVTPETPETDPEMPEFNPEEAPQTEETELPAENVTGTAV